MTKAGSRLPSVTLRSLRSGVEVSLRSGRGPVALATVHGPDCPGCLRFVEALAGVAETVKQWGGRIIVAVPVASAGDDETLVERAGPAIQVVADPDRRVASGVNAQVVLADEWGEVYFAEDAGSEHPTVSAAEVLEWVRFIVIQCPECEGPEGGWRAMKEG